jgi:hypothetical protein
MTSTPACSAIVLGWGLSPANRDATRLEPTISDSSPDRELVMASGRLKARKSVSGSARRIRKHDEASHRASGVRDTSVGDQQGRAKVLRHRVGRLVAILRALRQRSMNDAINGDDCRRSAKRRRWLSRDRMEDAHD